MSVFSYIETFQQKSDELDKAVSWLNKIGLNIGRTRIGQYKKDVTVLEDAYKEEKIDEVLKKTKLHKLYNSLNESDELKIIYRGLANITDDAFIKRLKKFIEGPEYADKETLTTASHISRDVEFELYVAAHFSVAGYKIDFGSDADLKIHDDTTLLFVECKRPKNNNSVEKNIREAFKQLTKRYNTAGTSTKVRGLAVFSISKLVNPGFKMLVVKSDGDREKQLNLVMERFFKDYNRYWQKELDIRTIGVLFHLQIPCVVQSTNIFGTCHRFGVNNTALYGWSDYHYFVDICTKFEKGHSALLRP